MSHPHLDDSCRDKNSSGTSETLLDNHDARLHGGTVSHLPVQLETTGKCECHPLHMHTSVSNRSWHQQKEAASQGHAQQAYLGYVARDSSPVTVFERADKLCIPFQRLSLISNHVSRMTSEIHLVPAERCKALEWSHIMWMIQD